MTKLWHDDVRRPPDDTWVWAWTNAMAKEFLSTLDIVECSLDHDLGQEAPGAIDVEAVKNAETGLDLVHWMVENDRVPAKVTIHSWNPDGAMAMAARLNRFGHDCYLRPYKLEQVICPECGEAQMYQDDHVWICSLCEYETTEPFG